MDQKELFDRLEELEWEDFEVKEAKNSIPKSSFETVSGDQQATDVEIDAMYRDSAFGMKDKELTDFTIDDLDGKTITDYRTYMENVNREHRYNKLSTEELLEKLQVVVDGKITIGGMLVFGREDNINRMLTDFRVDYLEIMGTSYSDAPTRYSYRLFEEENLFRFYFSIFERLMKKIDLPFTMRSDGFATDNQPQLVAIREALVNLLMHSDYFSPMKPRIRVFLDRIEFLNPGSLPKDIDSIMKEDFTMPRNPIVTRIFRVIKLAENAGSGFDKMINGWKTYYDEPVVSGGIDFYKITFPLTRVGESSEKTREKTSEIIREKTGEKTREKILELIIQTPQITTDELAEMTGITAKGIEWQIKKLKDMGLLKRIGPDKGGMWEVVKK